MYPSLSKHFKSIDVVKPGTDICWVQKHEITAWTITSSGKWDNLRNYLNLKEFEQENGELKSVWENVKLVNGNSLLMFYQDAGFIKDIPYIVETTRDFEECIERKPTVHSDYFIKDNFKETKKRLPELRGIF